jgi:transposase-like protein
VPLDRGGSFEPQLVAKGQTWFDGSDDKILSLYARGMTVREIQGHLAELYGAEVSPDLISRVTHAVLEDVREWQGRPLDAVYPIVLFDALRVKIRDEGLAKNQAVYVALAYNGDGEKDVLGLWIEQTEGAKFWMRVYIIMNNYATLKTAAIKAWLARRPHYHVHFTQSLPHGSTKSSAASRS